MTLLALAVASAAVVALAAAYGLGAFSDAWSHLHAIWLVPTVAGVIAAIPCYAACYRALARFDGGPRLSPPLLMRMVIAGFGLFAAGGGFWMDQRALHTLEGDGDDATVRVLGLGALEWAVLAPAACVSAVVLLVSSNHMVMPSLLWPWALAVPAGFAIGLTLAVPERRGRLCSGGGAPRAALCKALCGVGVLTRLSRQLPRYASAWIGMALYWCLEIASFYGAIRFIGLRPDLGAVVLAYATGYALTRRSMPLGGAGITEVLMTFALHWVGAPVPPALAVVVVYRVFNFALPAVPALAVWPQIRPLLSSSGGARIPGPDELHRSAVGLS